MSRKGFSILAGLCGFIGVVMLITSFIINPGPPPNATIAQIMAFGRQYHQSIILGAWLQAVSPPLIVCFAFAVVHLARESKNYLGWITFFAGIILVTVSLIEVTFYFSAVNSTNQATVIMSLELIQAVQHLYSIIAAPMLFFTLSSVILGSGVLSNLFAYLGFTIGFAFTVLGIAGLFYPLQDTINYVSIFQGFWWMGASLSLLIKAAKPGPNVAEMKIALVSGTYF